MSFLDFNEINEVHIEISSKCQLNCVHCSGHDAKLLNGMGYELDHDFVNFLSYLKRGMHLYITGGEPLLSDDLWKILNYCNSSEILTGIFTSFNIFDDTKTTLRKLGQHNLNDMYVSIFDVLSQQHDEITQVEGSWHKSRLALMHAREYGIAPKVNLVITQKNCERLNAILHEIDSWGMAEIRVLRLIRHGLANINWNFVGVSDCQQDEIVQRIFEQRDCFNTKLSFSGFPNIAKCRPFESEYHCGAGKTLCYIDYSGDIYPCASKKNQASYILGNIKMLDSLENKKITNLKGGHGLCR